MPRRKRFEIAHQPRFITCSCYSRLPLFQNDAIKDAFVEEFAQAQERYQFELHAWVVMPEHIHLLLTPDDQAISLAGLLGRFKGRFASRVLKRWYELNASILDRIRDVNGKAHFWLAGGGYDRNIFTADEYVEKSRYIHINPVRRGLVELPEDWRWSSAKAYATGDFNSIPRITPLSA